MQIQLLELLRLPSRRKAGARVANPDFTVVRHDGRSDTNRRKTRARVADPDFTTVRHDGRSDTNRWKTRARVADPDFAAIDDFLTTSRRKQDCRESVRRSGMRCHEASGNGGAFSQHDKSTEPEPASSNVKSASVFM